MIIPILQVGKRRPREVEYIPKRSPSWGLDFPSEPKGCCAWTLPLPGRRPLTLRQARACEASLSRTPAGPGSRNGDGGSDPGVLSLIPVCG